MLAAVVVSFCGQTGNCLVHHVSLLSHMYRILSNIVLSRSMLCVKNSVTTRHLVAEDCTVCRFLGLVVILKIFIHVNLRIVKKF